MAQLIQLQDLMSFKPQLGQLVEIEVLVAGRIGWAGDNQIKLAIVEWQLSYVLKLKGARR